MEFTPEITLSEILRLAEVESGKYHHYYIGVEHLFIALTKLRNGLTSKVLEICNIEPSYLRRSIRDTVGQNDANRYWPGFPKTPRADYVLKLATQFAKGAAPEERHVLMAILEEGDSIPLRTLDEMGIHYQDLKQVVLDWQGEVHAEAPPVQITEQTKNALTIDHRAVLKRMFRSYERIIVEREMSGESSSGYSNAYLVLVQPFRNGRAETRVVVRIDEKEDILHEKRRYDSYVQYTLPAMAARLIDNPALPSNSTLGGLKYIFVKPSEDVDATDLRASVHNRRPEDLYDLIKSGVYQNYRETWWSQRERYRFGVWREYEQVLPAAIEIEIAQSREYRSRPRIIQPLENWSRKAELELGQFVELNNFVVQKVRSNGVVQIAAGASAEAVNRSSKVEVRGIEDLENLRRGQTVDGLIGRIIKTRREILIEQVQSLEPDFDPLAKEIPVGKPLGSAPNPLAYIDKSDKPAAKMSFIDRFLAHMLDGNLSIIHGDLHLGNIIARGRDAWLIDFTMAREGHTLFDWATLEVSLLSSFVVQYMNEGWTGVREVASFIDKINRFEYHRMPKSDPLTSALKPIIAIREVVSENLARDDHWEEYYIPLTFLALRGLSWQTSASLQARRLLFVVAALATVATLNVDSGTISSAQLNRNILETAIHQPGTIDSDLHSKPDLSDD